MKKVSTLLNNLKSSHLYTGEFQVNYVTGDPPDVTFGFIPKVAISVTYFDGYYARRDMYILILRYGEPTALQINFVADSNKIENLHLTSDFYCDFSYSEDMLTISKFSMVHAFYGASIHSKVMAFD